MKNRDREFNEELLTELILKGQKHCDKYNINCDGCKYKTYKTARECATSFALDYLNQEYKPKKVFSEVEKIIIINVDPKFKYVMRAENGELWCSIYKSYKSDNEWTVKESKNKWISLTVFKHLFQSIQFSDPEPTSFEDILGGKENE